VVSTLRPPSTCPAVVHKTWMGTYGVPQGALAESDDDAGGVRVCRWGTSAWVHQPTSLTMLLLHTLPRAGSTGVGVVHGRGASFVGPSNVGGARRFARPDSRSTSDWVPACSAAAQEVEALLMHTHSLAKGAQWMTDSPPLSPMQGQPQSTQPREIARRCGCRSALQRHPPRRRLSHPPA
jgi:hypothetical protein